MSHPTQPDSQQQQEEAPDESQATTARESFPLVLYALLEETDAKGNAHIVSWQPHGRCFIVRRRKAFEKEVMPMYFRMSKFASFQRQLNLYGFRRISKGQDKEGYYHDLFLQGRKDLCEYILRRQVKESSRSKLRAGGLTELEPDFYQMGAIVQGAPDSKMPPTTTTTTTQVGPSNAEVNAPNTTAAATTLHGMMTMMLPPVAATAASQPTTSTIASFMAPTVTAMQNHHSPFFMAPFSTSSSSTTTASNTMHHPQLQQQLQQHHQLANSIMPAASLANYNNNNMGPYEAALRAMGGGAGPHAFMFPPANAFPSTAMMHQQLLQQQQASAANQGAVDASFSSSSLSNFHPNHAGYRSDNLISFPNSSFQTGVASAANNMLSSPSHNNNNNNLMTQQFAAGSNNDLQHSHHGQGQLILQQQQQEASENRSLEAFLAALQFEPGEIAVAAPSLEEMGTIQFNALTRRRSNSSDDSSNLTGFIL